ncbi:MAG TPA: GDSL-type esterase/lipase family protein [Actinomycetes bacterium]
MPVTSSRRRPAARAARLARLAGVPALSLALLVGCTGQGDADPPASRSAAPPSSGPDQGSASSATPSDTTAAAPGVYVAVGASETVGVGADDPVRQAWPRVLHDSALPAATYVNVGVSGGTVAGALTSQLPAALAAEPDVVTVWLAVNDLVAAVPVRAYERRLGRLVHRLRGGGSTEVLVGNVPDLWRLPAYRACQPGSQETGEPCLLPVVPSEREVRDQVRRFNAAVRRVAAAEGARLVDLSRVDDLSGLTSADGFHPSTAGHRRLAAAFAAELPR